jgi:hypothetical protein
MAYDYSPGWLARRMDTVRKLIQIVQSGEVLHVESPDWDSVKSRQLEINNCLASMERNMPDMSGIRTKLRTWTDYRGDKYHLYVGTPSHKIAGRPGRKDYAWTDQYNAKFGASHLHDEKVQDKDSLTRFVGVVLGLPKSTISVTANVTDMNENSLDYFKDVFEHHGWAVSAEGNQLNLKRTS